MERAISSANKGDLFGRIDFEQLGRCSHALASSKETRKETTEAIAHYRDAVAYKRKGNVFGHIDHVSLGRSYHCLAKSLFLSGQREISQQALSEALGQFSAEYKT